MKQKGAEKERDRDRVVLKSKNYIYFGQILNPKTTLILGQQEYTIKRSM